MILTGLHPIHWRGCRAIIKYYRSHRQSQTGVKRAWRESASTAFAIEADGIIGRLVHISGLCSLSFNAVKGKAGVSYR